MIEMDDHTAKIIANKLSTFVKLIQGMNVPDHAEDIEMLLSDEVADTNIIIENIYNCLKV